MKQVDTKNGKPVFVVKNSIPGISKRNPHYSPALNSLVRRFRQKVASNRFNWFITVCCDPEKFPDQEVFKKELKQYFSYFAVNHGWRYIGFFEEPEGGNLHFHCVAFIPENGMVGKMIQNRAYSVRRHTWIDIESNSFFLERFGLNSFDRNIHPFEWSHDLDLFLLYLRNGGKLIYSKGLRSEPEMVELEFDDCFLHVPSYHLSGGDDS